MLLLYETIINKEGEALLMCWFVVLETAWFHIAQNLPVRVITDIGANLAAFSFTGLCRRVSGIIYLVAVLVTHLHPDYNAYLH